MARALPYRSILRRVGITLIIVGLVDIGIMTYCIINGISYSSSFNIFAVIGGILLLRGSIRTAKFLASVSAFFLAAFGCMFLFFLFSIPAVDFDITSIIWFIPFSVAVLGFLYWVYRQLRLEPVLQARRDAGLSDAPSKTAFLIGLLFPPVIALIALTMVGRDGPYRDLENAFSTEGPKGSQTLTSADLVLTSNRHRGAFSYRGVLSIGLSGKGVDVEPGFPLSLVMKNVQIPMESISGCGKSCFGPSRWDADLLLGSLGIEMSIEGSEEVLEWCWQSGLPMISGKDRGNWLYKGGKLPSRTEHEQVTREEYARQTKSRCLGY